MGPTQREIRALTMIGMRVKAKVVQVMVRGSDQQLHHDSSVSWTLGGNWVWITRLKRGGYYVLYSWNQANFYNRPRWVPAGEHLLLIVVL